MLNGMFGRLPLDRPGWSAQHRHDELAKRWRQRFFGRRLTALVWTALALLVLLMTASPWPRHYATLAGFVVGMTFMAVWMFPSAMRPGYIGRWQLGAWGEQMTARELKRLKRDGWVVRHDLRWGERGNHDHLVVGGGVYVLNSKNLKDSQVSVEGSALRVQRIDDPDDSYLADRWARQVAKEARSLKWELDRAADTSVYVYPVLVIWGDYAAGQEWIGDVAVVRGDLVADWIKGRKADLLTTERRARVERAARALPTRA